jgi:hypothetical protein
VSVLGGNPLLLGSAAGSPTDPTFPVQRSVRLRSSASAYFNRTPASAGNRTTWTFSAWVKRGSLGGTGILIDVGGTANLSDYQMLWFSSDAIDFHQQTTTGYTARIVTNAVCRDPSSWYHIVAVWNTSSATTTLSGTSSDRMQLWINGVQVNSFSSTTVPTQNLNSRINLNALTTIGQASSGTAYSFDGYLTEVNFVDGQALTPLSFGGYNPGTNVWEPRQYTGTYGTNGFYLKFADNSAATAAAIGKDSSGNGNNWTPNNISVTAGATYDSMLDVPTNTSPTNANFPTLNVIAGLGNGTYSDGNLGYLNGVGATWKSGVASMGVTSGKYYFEYTITAVSNSSNFYLGVAGSTYTGFASYLGRTSDSWAFQWNGASSVKTNNDISTTVNTAGSISVNNVIQVAIDLNTGSIWWGRNNTWVQGDPSAGTGASYTNLTGTILPAFAVYSNGGDKIAANFGQRPFTYTPPTGFLALNTFNLPDPTIPSGDDFHRVYTYTGNGGGLQVGEIQKPASLFNLDRSLRLRSNASAYLSRTPASATNRKTWTWSGWVKRGALGVNLSIMGAQANGNSNTQRLNLFWQATTDTLCINDEQINISTNFALVTTRTFKDPSKWYHILVLVDTTQATSSNRLKLYIDGVQETAFSTAVYPSLNFDSAMNNTVAHYHGYYNNLGTTIFYNDGYLADVYFIDGQALDPTNFGAYDGNYYWTPKAYTGTYGTNGFHLEFEDFSAATAAAIGKDTSGNVNNWTPTNINLTTPEVDNEYWDSYTDVPTLTSADTCSYCTLDPLQVSSTGLRNGNLTAVWTAANTAFKQRATYTLNTGKWYFEGNIETFTIGNAGNTNYAIGFITTAAGVDTHVSFGWTTNGTSMKLGYRYDVAGSVVQNVTYNTTTPVATDIFGIEYDVDNGTANFYKNGTLMGSASGLALGTVNPQIWRTGTSNSATMHVNFGQRAFKYTPSTGYKKINAFNVAEVTGDLETPDFVWIKSRSATTSHALFNSVTGVGKYLSSNATTAETTDVNSLIQFNKNGFLLGNAAIVNTSAATYVASAWKSGATTVTNTDGSISAQVRANQTAGFSIVTYTGIGSSPKTVGHGLGVAPKMILHKDRGNAFNWRVWHTSLGASQIIEGLNTTSAASSQTTFNSTLPTSSVISVGNTDSNTSGYNYLMYVFAEIAGFSKFGSYTGNGSADGPFVYLGFRPRWIMIKNTVVGTDSWQIWDTARNTFNVSQNHVYPNLSNAETSGTGFYIDIISNGFKIRTTNSSSNNSGNTLIYAAFAENPFKYSLAR